MPEIEPKGLAEILAEMTKSTALGEQLERSVIWRRWAEIVGPVLCGHGRPRGVREKRLYIEIDAPVWMNKFSYQTWEIVAKVNELAGKELVNDVFLVLWDDEMKREEQGEAG